MNTNKAANVLLTTCSNCKKDEKILFVTDPDSFEVAKIMWDAATDFPNKTLVMMKETNMHGEDPIELVGHAMKNADVIFGITKFSLFHSQARKDAVANGARFVNMVDYNTKMMEKGGLHCNFEEIGKVCSIVSSKLENRKICRITTAKGTDFTCEIEGIKPTPQYGRSLNPGSSSSPPDIECATCALEGTGEGIIVVDGSIPHPELGLIVEDIKLTVKKGFIVKVEGGQQAEVLERILKDFNDPNVYNLGEIGIGLNPMCELNGSMLEDEGCSETLHFGAGDNRGFGGKTASKYHLDIIIKEPDLEVDGEKILDKGRVI
jgi:leucyl aminopeptidase (aminopeptidase T)